jgi:hypothetical protein
LTGAPGACPVADEGEPTAATGPRARSGLRVLIVVAAAGLLFLAVLWYATFLALNARGPDRAFLQKESWANGTVVFVVTDLDVQGEVQLSTLTVNITDASAANLYSGPPGLNQSAGGFIISVRWVDTDNSTTLTRGDKLNITTDPESALDNLALSTLYIYSNGREWARQSLT